MSTTSISGRIARPLLASIFITSGLEAAQHPEGKVKAAEKVTGPLTERVAALSDDTVTLIRINGVVQVVAGTLLSLGILRRTAATLLIGSLILTTLAGPGSGRSSTRKHAPASASRSSRIWALSGD